MTNEEFRNKARTIMQACLYGLEKIEKYGEGTAHVYDVECEVVEAILEEVHWDFENDECWEEFVMRGPHTDANRIVELCKGALRILQDEKRGGKL